MLIHDIKPGKAASRATMGATKKLLRFHQLTNITALAHPQLEVRHYKSFDIIRKPKRQPTPALADNKPSTEVTRAARPGLLKKMTAYAQYPLIVVLTVAVLNSTALGQVLIIAFAVLAIFVKIRSRYTFAMAGLLVLGVVIFELLDASLYSERCATYAYELFVVGILQKIISTWLEERPSRITN